MFGRAVMQEWYSKYDGLVSAATKLLIEFLFAEMSGKSTCILWSLIKQKLCSLTEWNALHLQEGGAIGLVENGDIITIDIQKRRMDVDLTDTELDERREKWKPPTYKADRGVLYMVCSFPCIL